MPITAPKGMKDILPAQSPRWQHIEQTMRETARLFGFREVRTPVIEHTELFLRGVGSTTDIVQKEMYTFADKGGRSITLKPESTAGVVRMYNEHALHSDAAPQKLYYLNSPHFRYERPQAGRLREHHQFGVELLGASAPSADAEVITLASALLQKLGVTELHVKLNSIGCSKCRGAYQVALKSFLHAQEENLCPLCRERMDANPLRTLDCKNPNCQETLQAAPQTMHHICEDCQTHMSVLQTLLDAADLRYEIDAKLVRGLDYYTRTVFEIVSDKIGAQGAVCGGGRYDGLVEELGGPPTPAMGFGMGMERLLMVMEQAGASFPEAPRCDILILPLGEAQREAAFRLVCELRALGIAADTDHVGRSLKAQMKYADKAKARHTLVLGENELTSGKAIVKRMEDGTQTETPLDAAAIAATLA
ncbi:MAG: histidine--tRNA ligase [Clostridiales bacterium]|nr:histidine--tRNA ligase [Clostridiales bacterium]